MVACLFAVPIYPYLIESLAFQLIHSIKLDSFSFPPVLRSTPNDPESAKRALPCQKF